VTYIEVFNDKTRRSRCRECDIVACEMDEAWRECKVARGRCEHEGCDNPAQFVVGGFVLCGEHAFCRPNNGD